MANEPGSQEVLPQSPPSEEQLKAMEDQIMNEILDPSHAALLVIDLQEDFVSENGKAKKLWDQPIEQMQEVVPRIEEMIELFRALGRPVIFTQIFEDPELRGVAGRGRFVFFERGDREGNVACLRGTPGAELVIKPKEGETVITKTRGSAFIGTELPQVLEKHGVRTVFLTGVKTNRCVGSTQKDIYDDGRFYAPVVKDCVGSDDLVQHETTLKEMEKFYPPIVTSQQLKEAWQAAAPTPAPQPTPKPSA